MKQNEWLNNIINTLNNNGYEARHGSEGLTLNKTITIDGVAFVIPGSDRGENPHMEA